MRTASLPLRAVLPSGYGDICVQGRANVMHKTSESTFGASCSFDAAMTDVEVRHHNDRLSVGLGQVRGADITMSDEGGFFQFAILTSCLDESFGTFSGVGGLHQEPVVHHLGYSTSQDDPSGYADHFYTPNDGALVRARYAGVFTAQTNIAAGRGASRTTPGH
ncbi:hypothetical protein LZ32DRAFT_654457 [Colletotrichum eremochloae]|nr:hypothetical protein LZ32DRAFT_654457 [Colletotrichum eremochloae]